MTCSNLRVDAETKLLGLLGHRVSHSASPAIHNAALHAMGLNLIYLVFDVPQDRLEHAVIGLKSVGAKGFNVTIPHKVEVISFLDDLDPYAQKIGAVNTVVIVDGKAKGYNTDAEGFMMPLKKRKVDVRSLNACIIGAGGAARAVAVALGEAGCQNISILARKQEKARALIADLEAKLNVSLLAARLGSEDAERILYDSTLLVNATPIGMAPFADEQPLRSEDVKKGVLVYDLVYRPVETMFLRSSRKKGAMIVPGYEMLVEQAASSLRLWTGVDPPREVMEQAALSELMVK